MVKVAFIVEGKVEQIFIDNLHSNGWLESKNIEKVGPTIDAKGGGNLCPRNMNLYVEQAKERLGACSICTIVLAKKAIEAWFLADNEVLKILTEKDIAYINPEVTEEMPYDEYKKILLEYTGRGTGSKVTFAKKVIKKHSFSIDRASYHPNCQSAKYFIEKITNIGRL